MDNPWTTKLSQVARLEPGDKALLDRLTARPPRVCAGRTLIRQGEPPDHVNVVMSGWIARYKILGGGQRQIMALLTPGDMCDMHVFLLKTMDHSLCAIGDAEVAMLSRHDVMAILHTRPVLTGALWWSSLQNEAILREWITSLGRRDAYARTAHLMYELHLRLSGAGVPNGAAGYEFPLTQTDLADALGMSVVHVNRVVQRLREDDLIVLKRGRLFIPDPDALAAAAEFDPSYLHLDSVGGARDGAL